MITNEPSKADLLRLEKRIDQLQIRIKRMESRALFSSDGVAEINNLQASPPSAPTEGAKFYVDSFGGKRRLMAQFPTGLPIQFAIEL